MASTSSHADDVKASGKSKEEAAFERAKTEAARKRQKARADKQATEHEVASLTDVLNHLAAILTEDEKEKISTQIQQCKLKVAEQAVELEKCAKICAQLEEEEVRELDAKLRELNIHNVFTSHELSADGRRALRDILAMDLPNLSKMVLIQLRVRIAP